MSTVQGSGLDRQGGATEGLKIPEAQAFSVNEARLQMDPVVLQREVSALVQKAGFERTADGLLVVRDTSEIGKTESAKGLTTAEKLYGTESTQLKPPAPPRVELTPDTKAGAENFARQLDAALNDFFLNPTSPGSATSSADGDVKRLMDLSADLLLAAFLKLNIADPNNTVATHNKLHEFATQMREMAIREAQQKMKVAAEQMKEAEKAAEGAAQMRSIATIVAIVVAVVATIMTFGAAGPLAATALASLSTTLAAHATAIQIASFVAVLATQLGAATAENKAANLALDAQQSALDAKRFEKMAQMHQQQLQEEGEIIKTLIESKNKTVDAVLQMLNAMFASSVKLMSAAMAR